MQNADNSKFLALAWNNIKKRRHTSHTWKCAIIIFFYAICLKGQTERMLLVSDLNSSTTVVRNW